MDEERHQSHFLRFVHLSPSIRATVANRSETELELFLPRLTLRGSPGCTLRGVPDGLSTSRETSRHSHCVASTVSKSPQVTESGYQGTELCPRVMDRPQLANAQIHGVTKNTLVFLGLETVSVVASILGNPRKGLEWGSLAPPNTRGHSPPQYH